MKRIKFLLLIFLIAILSPNLMSAQNSTLTLSMSDTPLNEILNKIEKKTNYSFQYSTQVIDVKQKRTIHVKNQPIEAVLNILLKGTDIQYHIKGKQIILNAGKKETKKTPAKSKGIVMDSKTREPIIGASITVEGEKTGSISDIDGRFEIEAPEYSRLCVSYMGYVTQLVPVKANSLLEVWMSEDTKVIDEVVVVGYGAVSKKNLTTAIAQVKPEKIPQAAASNINQLLMGRAAGLQAIVNSTQPDGKVNISIRGGENPIYVVDGIVMPSEAISTNGGETGLPSNVNRGGLAGLNPSDIESVEILKDASAAIYGIGAANGVILITTKKGKEGTPRCAHNGCMLNISLARD